MTKKIGLILGSTRQGRISPSIASWVESVAAKNPNVEIEILDLKEINLPWFDEPTTPSVAPGVSEAAISWASKITSKDGLIILTPEYNAGYPAPLKNAIDYLKPELQNRPVFIVSYGYGGGASAAHQLVEVFNRIGAPVIEPGVQILIGDKLNETGGIDTPVETLAIHDAELEVGLTRIVEFVPTEAV